MVAQAAPVVPSRIGRHDVIGYIAAGGMSELFLGRDPASDRPVVIKRMLPHLARQTSFVSMFIDEARIGAMVHHPNLVEHLELGQVGTELYMVMEYLEGENLSGMIRRLIKRGEQLDYGLVAYIVAEACLGLHAAHSLTDDRDTPLHIVHRDVSPSNIFVTYSGEVKVLDFGIATAAQRLTQETATGELKGKFAYMSPEQCRGEKLDARSDIFSLGVVLYELGLQKRLFKRDNEMLVLNAVCEDPIPPPSREHAGYPAQLEAVCLRALARDRRKRYQSAKVMHADLVAAMTAIGVGSDPRESLAREMQRLFPERIAEKVELREQRASSQCDLSLNEVDLEIVVPDATRESSPRRAPSEIATRLERPPRRRWTIAALSAFVLALAIVVVILLVRDPASTPAPARAPVAIEPRTPAPGIAPPTSSTPPITPTARGVDISIESEPSGTVFVDGEQVGASPLTLHLQGERATVEIRRPGYVSLTRALVLDRDQRLVVTLTPQKRATTKPKPVRTPPPPTDGFKRFDETH